MSVRIYTADQLPAVARELVGGRTVIQIVAATDNVGWAATRTWEFARAVAAGERRVALVDLSLEQPALNPLAQNTADEGIVDAFLYGVSLSHVARQQDVPTLYYVAVGSRTNEPAEVWASRRWDRLARGFRNERAILITYIPPGALNRCALRADGMVVLAPTGYDPALDIAPGIARKLREGTPLLGVVTAAADTTPEGAPSSDHAETTEVMPAWDVSTAPPEPAPAAREAIQGFPLKDSSPTVQPRASAPLDNTTPTVPDDDFDLIDEFDPLDITTPSHQRSPRDRGSRSVGTEPRDAPTPEVTDPDLQTVPPATSTSERERAGSDQEPSSLSYEGPPIFQPSRRKPIGNVRFILASVLVVAAMASGYFIWSRRESLRGAEIEAQPVQPTDPPPATLEPVAAVPPPTPVEPLTDADSLYYAVQAAALNTLRDAMEHGRTIRRGNRPVTVSPVRISGRIWYRVIVGAYRSPAAADEGRRSLWRDGLVETGEGTILRTPHAFTLGRRDAIDSAQVEATTLWGRGIPAYVLPHDGGGIVAVGAFVRPEQADIAESILQNASLVPTLAPRLGSTQ